MGTRGPIDGEGCARGLHGSGKEREPWKKSHVGRIKAQGTPNEGVTIACNVSYELVLPQFFHLISSSPLFFSTCTRKLHTSFPRLSSHRWPSNLDQMKLPRTMV